MVLKFFNAWANSMKTKFKIKKTYIKNRRNTWVMLGTLKDSLK